MTDERGKFLIAWINRTNQDRRGFLVGIFPKKQADEIIECRNSLFSSDYHWKILLPEFKRPKKAKPSNVM